MGTLAFDFGGTRTRAAYFDDDLRLLRRDEMASRVQDGPQALLERLVALGQRVQQKDPVHRVGVSAPGPLDAERGIIRHAWTLPEWRDVAIGPHLAQVFRAPAYVQNDANCGALAEYHQGAGQGCDPLIYLTLSTGIGGGVVIGGQLFSGWRGLAAEPGHQVFRLPDGQVKKLEELASGTGLALRATERLSAYPDSLLHRAATITGQGVGEAARAGDALALAVVREAGEWLGLGLVNLLHLFNPRAIVIGGSVAQLGEMLFGPARAMFRHLLTTDFLTDDLLRPAALGDDVCLVGAAYFAARR